MPQASLNGVPDDVPLHEVDLSVQLRLHAVQHLGELLHAVLPRLEGGDVVGRVGLPAGGQFNRIIENIF